MSTLRSAIKRLETLQQLFTHGVGQRHVIPLRLAALQTLGTNETPRTLLIHKSELSAHRNTAIGAWKVLRVQVNIDSQALQTLPSAILELPFNDIDGIVHIVDIDCASAGKIVGLLKLRLNFRVMLVVKNGVHFIFLSLELDNYIITQTKRRHAQKQNKAKY